MDQERMRADEEIMLAVREHLLPHWQDYHLKRSRGRPEKLPETASEGMCRPTTAFLLRLLRKAGHGEGLWIEFGHCRMPTPGGLEWLRNRGQSATAANSPWQKGSATILRMHDTTLIEGVWLQDRAPFSYDHVLDSEGALWLRHAWLTDDERMLDPTAGQFGLDTFAKTTGEPAYAPGELPLTIGYMGMSHLVRRWEGADGYDRLVDRVRSIAEYGPEMSRSLAR